MCAELLADMLYDAYGSELIHFDTFHKMRDSCPKKGLKHNQIQLIQLRTLPPPSTVRSKPMAVWACTSGNAAPLSQITAK